MKINELFLYLPIAAAIKSPKDNILCMHGGIGRLSSAKEAVERIEALTRPICVRMEVQGSAKDDIVRDFLWSDPSKTEDGVLPSSRDGFAGNIKNFGPDRVNQFLADSEFN